MVSIWYDLIGGLCHMNNRKYHTDPETLLTQGQAIMSSSDESRYLFRVFAVNMVLAGTPASQVGASAGFTKAAVTGWVKTVDEHGFEALRPQQRAGRPSKLTQDQLKEIDLVLQSDPKDHLYNKEISSRVKYFLLLQIFCILGSFIVCEMLIKTYDENNKEECGIKFLFKINEIKSLCKKKKDDKLLLIESSDEVFSINPEIKEVEDDKNKIVKSEKKTKTRKEKIKMVLKSWKFWRYNLISLSSSPIINMIFSMYRSLGETYQIEQNALQLLGVLNSVIGFIFSFIFGVLCDYVNFRVLLFINNMIGSIVGITYYHSFHDTFSFTILTLIIAVQSSGYYCMKEFHLIKVFGIDILVDITGVVSLTTGICVIILTIFTYLIEISIEQKDLAYLIIFPAFGIFNFLGVVLGFFEDEEPFDFDE